MTPQHQAIGPGFVLGGRYHLRQLLGSGSMGQVFLAYDELQRCSVAVKVLRTDRPLDRAIKRLKREIQSIARIKHESIVLITDVGQPPDGGLYFVMEYLEGEELASTLHREGRMPWRRACKIALQICGGLGAAHDVGIVHRDLKLENCFRLSPGEDGDIIKILDFGIAKIIDPRSEKERLTDTGVVLGTPEYMSPEQCHGRDVDHRADVYALGILLYELVAGMTPFTGDSFLDIAQLHINAPMPPLASIVGLGAIPEALEDIVFRALAKHRQDRFQTMGAFASALRKLDEYRDEVPSEPPTPASLPLANSMDLRRTVKNPSVQGKAKLIESARYNPLRRETAMITHEGVLEALRYNALDVRLWERDKNYARVTRLTPRVMLGEYYGNILSEAGVCVASAIADFVDDGVTTVFVDPSRLHSYPSSAREQIVEAVGTRKERFEAIHFNIEGSRWTVRMLINVVSIITKVVYKHTHRESFEAALHKAVNEDLRRQQGSG